MALPTLEEYRQSSAAWRGEHMGIKYKLNHHGVSEYSPKGTWCYYIYITSETFENPEHFSLFNKEPEIVEVYGGTRERYNYMDVPDCGFHGGITWYDRQHYLDRNGNKQILLEIGCDYAHIWDREGGYWQGLDDVREDATRLIEKIIKLYPVKLINEATNDK